MDRVHYLLAIMSALAIIPILFYSTTKDPVGYLSAISIMIIAGSIYLMFRPDKEPEV